MARKKTEKKRSQHYINKGFQVRFMAQFILILLLGGIISVGLTLFNTKDSLTSTYVGSRLVIENTSLAILPSVVYTTLITTVLIGVLGGLVTLLVSHKIAGPMYRFEADIQRVA
ncbi:MAG: hypothetical protein HUN05_21655 [Desulfobacter sp.]|nr:MAG: hypothetical protein HUN05_21655 [Desulfobacter sp.]